MICMVLFYEYLGNGHWLFILMLRVIEEMSLHENVRIRMGTEGLC